MNILILKAQWELFGLRAPAFSWVVSAGLIIYFFWVYLRQWRESRIRQSVLLDADRRLKTLRDSFPREDGRRLGIPKKFYGAMVRVFNDFPILHPVWQTVMASIVTTTDPNGEERFWVSEDTGSAFNESLMAENQGYRNASSIMTGVGLLATFLALLVALLDVRLTGNRIQGLDMLIYGLSGKFLSSVVAIACATTLIFAEKSLFHKTKKRAVILGLTLTGILPRLTQAQILLDSHQELVNELRYLRAANSQPGQSITDGFTKTVEPALEKMAASFTESLTGAAKGQFGQVTESLGDTARLLHHMNDQLTLTGRVLNELTDMARQTAARETTDRQDQINRMTGAVDTIMDRLEGHTGTSMGSMEKAMAAITCDMSSKLTDLSAQMAAVIEKTSAQSAGTVREVMAQAGAISNQSAEQLAQLLEKHSVELSRVNDLKSALDKTIRQFTSSIEKQDEMTSSLAGLTAEVNGNIASLTEVARSIAESQAAATGLLTSSSSQIESLKEFAREQQAVWDGIKASMTNYEAVFKNVEGHAKELLTQIAHHLGGYSTVTEKHFNLLTTTADNFISQATGRLSGSIDELGEQLDELHSAVNKMAYTSQAMR